MVESTQDPPSTDEILAQLVLEAERLGERGEFNPEAFVSRYPHLAAEIRQLFHDQQAVAASCPVPPSVPERLGDFRIVRLIAHGGMGEVYEAVQEALKRRVAVKIIRRGRVSPEARTRFLREQEVLARLHQTHIVPVHFAGAEGALQYFVMPFIDGAPLHHVVQLASAWESTHPGSQTPPLEKLADSGAQRPEESSGMPAEFRWTTRAPETKAAPSPDTWLPPAAPANLAPQRLSAEYFRSVAQVMADAAEAIHHAHQSHPAILHRDLKPSNIMVDTAGHCWIIDYGLAGYLSNGAPAEGAPASRVGAQSTSGLLGTPQYMAPEQFEGHADVRTDVWGLGVTLYELLTLHKPFTGTSCAEMEQRIRSTEATPARVLVPSIPADLAAICQKAMQKRPGDRYASTQAFAEDLRRWLRWEPVSARPTWAARRAWLWARRNRGWAAAIVTLLLAVCALSVGGHVTAQRQLREAEHRLNIHELVQLRHSRKHVHWKKDAEQLARKAAALENEIRVRSEFVAALRGLDARQIMQRQGFAASSVAFSADGAKLLIGGDDREPAKLWTAADDTIALSQQTGAGPVAFGRNGEPLQLIAHPQKPHTLLLWDVAKRAAVQEFPLKREADQKLDAMALAVDGLLIAAALVSEDGKAGVIQVWETATGKRLHAFKQPATALAFSPNAAFLGSGDAEGRVTLHELSNPQESTTWPASSGAIRSLAFGRNPLRGAHPWRLATGDDSGGVVVWDLTRRSADTHCRGSQYEIMALAFSVDGTLLLSAGRVAAIVWDAHSGQELLRFAPRNVMEAVAFSPDGTQIAVGSRPVWGGKGENLRGGVDVWMLEDEPAVRVFRGLPGHIEAVYFSRDDRLIAAVSQNNRIGVWEVDSGRLRFTLQRPLGYASSYRLCFSADGNRLAFAGRTEAKLWDAKTGEELASAGPLAPALTSCLGFDPAGRWIAMRVETQDGRHFPSPRLSFKDHPRVCRIWELFPAGGERKRLIAQVKDFNRHVHNALGTEDARCLIIEGAIGEGLKEERWVKGFNGLTGAELWSLRSEKPEGSGGALTADPTGKHVSIGLKAVDPSSIVEIDTGKLYGFWSSYDRKMPFPNVRHWALGVEGYPSSVLCEGADARPLFIMHADRYGYAHQSDHAQNRRAGGSADGAVTVWHFNELQRRLTAVGLGW